MSNTKNDTDTAGIFLTGLVTGLVLGSAAGFAWAVVKIDKSGSSTKEPTTTPIAVEAAEVKHKPSPYETVMANPAKYCNGRPIGISGTYLSPNAAQLYCVEDTGELLAYNYAFLPFRDSPAAQLTLSRSWSIGSLQDMTLPTEVRCHDSEQLLGASLESQEVEGTTLRASLYQLWCVSEHALYSVHFGQGADQTSWREMSSTKLVDEFTTLVRVGLSLPQ